MKTCLVLSCAFGMAVVASAAGAQVTLYQQERFLGYTLTTDGPIDNLDRSGFCS